MNGPSAELRAQVAGYEHLDDGVQQALDLICGAVDAERKARSWLSMEDPYEVLGAIDAWAGLMSYVVADAYAPHSKMRYAAWMKEVSTLLRKAADELRGALEWVVQKLHCTGFSISVGYPWGVSVGLSFS